MQQFNNPSPLSLYGAVHKLCHRFKGISAPPSPHLSDFVIFWITPPLLRHPKDVIYEQDSPPISYLAVIIYEWPLITTGWEGKMKTLIHILKPVL